MHFTQVNLIESNEKRIQVLEQKVREQTQRIEDLDENYDKLYKFMMEKTEVVRRL